MVIDFELIDYDIFALCLFLFTTRPILKEKGDGLILA